MNPTEIAGVSGVLVMPQGHRSAQSNRNIEQLERGKVMPVTTTEKGALTGTPKTPETLTVGTPTAKITTPTATSKPGDSLTTADKRKRAADQRRRDAQVGEFKTSLSEAVTEVKDAFADVKSVTEGGDPVNLTPLMAAIDDLTAAVGDITAHGARNSHLSNADSKKLRDAQNELTQAFSDLRTHLEFPSMATDLTQLSTVIDNVTDAISDVSKAKP